MLILLKLFYEFFLIGLFTFGGGYAMIPLIKDVAINNGWLSEEAFVNFFDYKCLILAIVMGFLIFKFKKHPIIYIAIAAIIGIIFKF